MRTVILTIGLVAASLFAPAALAKGSCCSHPPASVYIYGPTSVPGAVKPGQPAQLSVRSIVQFGSFTSASVTPNSAFWVESTSCSGTVCYTVVGFDPTEGGNYTASLTILATGAYGSGKATTTLTGTGYGANFAWSAPINMSVNAGEKGSAQLTLQSTGQTPLTVLELVLSQSGTYLSLGPNNCIGYSILPGSSCLVTVDYHASLVETEATSYPMDGTISVVSPNTVTNSQGSIAITAIVQQGD
jgi:hypothetical protein